MKEVIISSIVAAFVAGSPLVFAEAGKTKPTDPTTGVQTTSPTESGAKKVSRSEAKKKCLDENSSMKSKELKDCIKNKMKG